MLLCGAAAVQVGTQVLIESPTVFARIEAELEALMASKGYSSIGVRSIRKSIVRCSNGFSVVGFLPL